MCEPTTIITTIVMAAIAAASTTMSIKTQNDAVQSQMNEAAKARDLDYAIQAEQQTQVQKQAALEESNRMRQAMIERAQIRVAQGESGVAGLSGIGELGATFWSQSNDLSIIQENKNNTIDQIQNNKKVTQTSFDSRINEAKSKSTSSLAAGLQIGMSTLSGAMQGYSAGNTLKGPSGGGAASPSSVSNPSKLSIGGDSMKLNIDPRFK